MTFRVFATSVEEPEQFREVPQVSLHLDRNALATLRELVDKYDRDFDAFFKLGHTHLSLHLHPRDYNLQQQDLISKDIMVAPLMTPKKENS